MEFTIRSNKAVLIAIAAFTMLSAALATGCGGGGRTFMYDSVGAPYEIVVVADHAEWDGAVGDTLRSIFHKRFPMVIREENTFDLVRTLPEGFKKLVTRHANIIIVEIDPSLTESSLEIASDLYAAPQTVLVARAPDEVSMALLLDVNRDDMPALFENAEKGRDVADALGHTPKRIRELIKRRFGFDMSMGPGYEVRSDTTFNNFLWVSYEMPTSSQGIIIYSYPFSSPADFERENLIRRRNEFVSLVPGENPGSYMSTNPEFIELLYRRTGDRQWSEMHGFWDVEGDFMGGPFTNYSTLDAAGRRIIAIDFYVFSPDPRNSQRNYIKQLEHFLYTVKIPDGSAPAVSAPAAPASKPVPAP